MDEQTTKTTRFDELRKTHSKAFMRWTEDEDKTLLDIYDLHKTEGADEFDAFLEKAGTRFGRKPNGIRGRLAKYFPDIPAGTTKAKKNEMRKRKNKEVSLPIHGLSKADESANYIKQGEVYGLPNSIFPQTRRPKQP